MVTIRGVEMPEFDDKPEWPYKWQHASFQRYSETGEYPQDADDVLDKYGEIGWELVSVTYVPLEPTPDGERGRFIFNLKRGPIKVSE